MSARPVRRRQTIFVGSKIRQLRKERSLTQAELAQRIGVQQSDLCRMENGEYKVSLDTLFKILGVFGLAVLTRGASAAGAFWGLLAGMATVWLVATYTSVHFLWYNVVGAITVFVVGMLLTALRPRATASA